MFQFQLFHACILHVPLQTERERLFCFCVEMSQFRTVFQAVSGQALQNVRKESRTKTEQTEPTGRTDVDRGGRMDDTRHQTIQTQNEQTATVTKQHEGTHTVYPILFIHYSLFIIQYSIQYVYLHETVSNIQHPTSNINVNGSNK